MVPLRLESAAAADASIPIVAVVGGAAKEIPPLPLLPLPSEPPAASDDVDEDDEAELRLRVSRWPIGSDAKGAADDDDGRLEDEDAAVSRPQSSCSRVARAINASNAAGDTPLDAADKDDEPAESDTTTTIAFAVSRGGAATRVLSTTANAIAIALPSSHLNTPQTFYQIECLRPPPARVQPPPPRARACRTAPSRG